MCHSLSSLSRGVVQTQMQLMTGETRCYNIMGKHNVIVILESDMPQKLKEMSLYYLTSIRFYIGSTHMHHDQIYIHYIIFVWTFDFHITQL